MAKKNLSNVLSDRPTTSQQFEYNQNWTLIINKKKNYFCRHKHKYLCALHFAHVQRMQISITTRATQTKTMLLFTRNTYDLCTSDHKTCNNLQHILYVYLVNLIKM